MIDLVLVSVLLIGLLFAVLQVAIYFYARNVAAASAADAARYAAAEGVDPRAGPLRAAALIRRGLDAADAAAVHCTGATGRDRRSGLEVVTVRCRGRIRAVFSPLPLPLSIDVVSTVVRERGP